MRLLLCGLHRGRRFSFVFLLFFCYWEVRERDGPLLELAAFTFCHFRKWPAPTREKVKRAFVGSQQQQQQQQSKQRRSLAERFHKANGLEFRSTFDLGCDSMNGFIFLLFLGFFFKISVVLRMASSVANVFRSTRFAWEIKRKKPVDRNGISERRGVDGARPIIGPHRSGNAETSNNNNNNNDDSNRLRPKKSNRNKTNTKRRRIVDDDDDDVVCRRHSRGKRK